MQQHTRPAKTALCLSGGGYRAVAFHTGVLWRLNELGYLNRLDRISAVSGGALLAGCLACAWTRLDFTHHGVAQNFAEVVAAPIRKLLDTTIGTPATLLGLLPGRSGNGELTRYFQDYCYGNFKLGEMPTAPDFIFCATDVRHGTLWTFDRQQMGNPETGWFSAGAFPLAAAIAASGAFPPILAPARIDLRPYKPLAPAIMQAGTAILADGGVYDDLALDPVSKTIAPAYEIFQNILLSDAGEALPVQPRPAANWLCQLSRVRQIAMSQVRLQRLDRARADIAEGRRAGAQFSLTADIPLNQRLPGFDYGVSRTLGALPTLYVRMASQTQRNLINWGYAICTASMRNAAQCADRQAAIPYPAA